MSRRRLGSPEPSRSCRWVQRRGTSCASAGGGLCDGSGWRLPPGSCPSFPHRSQGANRGRRRPPAPGFQSLARSHGLGGGAGDKPAAGRDARSLCKGTGTGVSSVGRGPLGGCPPLRGAPLCPALAPACVKSRGPEPHSRWEASPGESSWTRISPRLRGRGRGRARGAGREATAGPEPRLPPGPKALRSSALGILPRKPRARPPDAPSPRVPPAGERDSGAKSVALLVTERWGTLKIHAMSPVHYI